MNKLKAISNKYETYIQSLVPSSDTELYSEKYSRAYFMIASTPLLVILLLLEMSIEIQTNPQMTSINILSIVFACVILAFTPLFLQLTRELSLTASLVILSLMFSIFANNYISPSLTSAGFSYLPLVILFGVYISGLKQGFIYLLICYVLCIAQVFRIIDKFGTIDPLFLEKSLNIIRYDIPLICTITFFLAALYESQRLKKNKKQEILLEQMGKQQEFLSNSLRDNAISEMAGGIAHEINNPLFAISGTVEQALKDPSINLLNPRLVEKFKKVKSHSERIHKLLDSLLQFGSNENPGDDSIDIQRAIKDSLSLQKRYLEQSGVEVKTAGENFKVQIDLFSAMKILNNLLSNARQAAESQDENWVKIHISNDGILGYIDIIDSGSGIDPEISPKIFQPFFTTREIGQGAGLGLSESLGLAKKFNGDLQYQLHSGNTCFRMILPLSDS